MNELYHNLKIANDAASGKMCFFEGNPYYKKQIEKELAKKGITKIEYIYVGSAYMSDNMIMRSFVPELIVIEEV